MKAFKKIIARFFIVLIGLYLVLKIAALPGKRICAQLPNGLLFGSESVIRTQRFRGTSIYVFKRADGTVLIPDATDFLYVSKTTIYGLAYVHGADGKKNYRFAYRPDVDLVFKKKDPETYARLVAEAGPLLDELLANDALDNIVIHNLPKTFYWLKLGGKLIKSPRYRRTDCPISWYS